MLKRVFCVLGFLCFGTGLASAAAPADDLGKQLGLFLARHGYGVMRVDTDDKNDQLVRAVINGKGVTMVVDTGCDATCLKNSSATDLGLQVVPTHKDGAGVGGGIRNVGVAAVKSFTLNGYEINRVNLIHVLPATAQAPWDGLFGYDCMKLNAVILPVGAKLFFFKPGATPIATVAPFLTAMGYRALPVTYGLGGLRIQGSLDGHPLTAVIDCGDAYTLFDSEFVAKTGASLRSSRLYDLGVDGRQIFTNLFVAHDLTFGPMSFGSPETTAASGTLLVRLKAQALLGYDLLAAHSAIIDLGHDVVWMK